MLSVGIIGISHQTASLALREAVSRGAEVLRGERAIFFPYSTVLLSTCNRTEIYFEAEDLGKAHSALLAILRAHVSIPFEHKLYSYFGNDCFMHLCKVTAGLESAILAETEIQRQVKLAYAHAKYLTPSLHYLFQKALKIGKNVRTHMASFQAPTLYGTLWQLAQWKDKRILMVGNSKVNRGFLSYLAHKQIHSVTLCTKHPEKISLSSVQLVDRSILKHWSAFDLIVSATQADEFLISGSGRSGQIIFDLSVPRNVDPQVNVRVYNIEEIDEMIKAKSHALHIERCHDLIVNNVERLITQYLSKHSRVLESV